MYYDNIDDVTDTMIICDIDEVIALHWRRGRYYDFDDVTDILVFLT